MPGRCRCALGLDLFHISNLLFFMVSLALTERPSQAVRCSATMAHLALYKCGWEFGNSNYHHRKGMHRFNPLRAHESILSPMFLRITEKVRILASFIVFKVLFWDWGGLNGPTHWVALKSDQNYMLLNWCRSLRQISTPTKRSHYGYKNN